MRALGFISQRVRRFAADVRAGATVEFVIIAPLLLTSVFSIFESGWLMTQSMMLDRGLDNAVRELRIGKSDGTDFTHAEVRTIICQQSLVIEDCENALLIELTPMTDYDADDPRRCIDRVDGTINPDDSFDPGARSEVMFVRVCAIVDPIFPDMWMGLGTQMPKVSDKDLTGIALISFGAFMNEPD